MKDIELIQSAKRKQETREIVKEILDFGVTENQKIDIMFNIAVSLEKSAAMKEITKMLKKYQENINKNNEEDIVNSKQQKVILT